ncbi:MAG: TrmH family RNA methyltransferase [Candidatus Kapaibacterium sp.]
MTEINNIKDSRIDHYRNLKFTPPGHKRDMVFIAEGEKVTLKLLKSGLEVISSFALKDYYERYPELFVRVPEDSRFTSDVDIFEKIIGFKVHTGIMAMGKIPPYKRPEELNGTIICANAIVDSENIGSICRNCAAFGFGSFLFDKQSSTPWLRRAVRVSMGAVFDLDVGFSMDLKTTIHGLKKSAYKVVAAETTDDAIPLEKYSPREKQLIIFGNESHGISEDILKLCDDKIYIPISDKIPSINVAATSAVIMHNIRKLC